VLVVGAVVAGGVRSRVGRRAALVLLVPVMTDLLGRALLTEQASPLYYAPSLAVAPVFYGVPLVVLLAVGGLPRRIGRRTDEPAA
jgi:hypothetical protein